MQLETAILANHAEVHGPLVSILGGGFEFYQFGQLPQGTIFYVAGVLARNPDEDMEDVATIESRLYDPNGRVMHEGRAQFDILHTGVAKGVPVRTGFALQLMAQFTSTGVHRVTLVHANEEIASLPFEVQIAI